ncbi:MAG TPA: cytochrome P450 [Acidimicrobiales bacterium]|nr:cytochrome P450 [Acidimicrobiales bacterium]
MTLTDSNGSDLDRSDLTLADIDLLEDTWAAGVPDDQFRLLRAEAPVYWHDHPEAGGFWAVTRYEDVKAISRDWRTYSTELGSTFIRDFDEAAMELVRMTLLNMDPPKHTRYRKLVSAGFTPRMIRALFDGIETTARDIVDRVADADGEVDFVEAVAVPLPLQIICDMIGVPAEDRTKVFEWSNRLVGGQDPDFSPSEDDQMIAQTEIYAYCDAIAADRRANPRDDIMSTLVHAEVEGDRLDTQELNLFFVLLCVAGNETTRNLISHAMMALIEHPDARRELAANIDDDALWNTATEEFLRWNGSIQNFRRTATQATRIRDTDIAEGDKVVIYYHSANRDDSVFTNPDTFDIHRSPNDHVSFGGGGTHFCLGANLARLEIRTMLREVLRRFPEAEYNGAPKRFRSDFVNGIKELPVKLFA